MRKLVAALLAAVLIGVVVIAVAATFSVERRAVAAVENVKRRIDEESRFNVEVGDVHMAWLPRPAVVIEDATVTMRKQEGSRPIVDKARVTLVPSLGSLLRGGQDIRRVEIHDARFVTRPETKESALSLLGLLRASPVPVELDDCQIDVDRGADMPVLDVQHVNLEFTPREGAVEVAGTMSPLGERSHGDMQATWQPGAGRTGGDALKLRLDVRGGDPAALPKILPLLSTATFTNDVTLQVTAEGFLGERSTETLPAEPLEGRLRAEAGLALFGLDKRAVFDSGVSLDDRRWVLHEGKGQWGERPFTFAGWIARGATANKVNLRMSFQDVDAGSVLADYGIEERWRPKAQVSGEIRMTGSFDYPLTRYEVKAPSVQYNAWPEYPISAGPTRVEGSLMAINAEASASFQPDELKVAHITIPKPLVGTRWWRDKLTVASLNLAIWGGKFDGSLAWEPKTGEGAKGGGLFQNVDAATFVANTLADTGLQLDGKLDASLLVGYRDGRFWHKGRFGVHEGTLGPKSVLRAVMNEVVASAGGEPALLDELAARHQVLSPERLRFMRVAADFMSVEQGVGLRVEDLVSEGGSLVLDGVVDANKRLSTTAVATFAPVVTSDLTHRLPLLSKLTANDGSLRVPVRVTGPPGDLQATVEDSFVAAVKKAREGKAVERITAEPPKRAFEITAEELPPLEEQFGR